MSATEFCQRMLPTQRVYSDLYQGDPAGLPEVIYEKISSLMGIKTPAELFDVENSEAFSLESMGSTPLQLQFLKTLICANRSKRLLEIGTFIGASTMFLAAALPQDGKVVTIEKFDKFANIARRNFEKNGFADKIELRVGDAMEVLRGMAEQRFDFAYIDGNKENYDKYFERIDPMMNPGGLIVVDDVFFSCDAFNAKRTTKKGEGAFKAMELAGKQERYTTTILPFGNGLSISVKSEE